MADQEHLDILKQGVKVWNQWREEHRGDIRPDLSGADLRGVNLQDANLSFSLLHSADLRGVNLSGVNLQDANLESANLSGADLSRVILFQDADNDFSSTYLRGANLSRANLRGIDLSRVNLQDANLESVNLSGADLRGVVLVGAILQDANLRGANLRGNDLSRVNLEIADLRGADLSEANLFLANLSRANLESANLRGAYLSEAMLVRTNLRGATMTECFIFGTSVWGVQLEGAVQKDLIITPVNDVDPWEPIITVDNLKIAQFIYLLLNNKEIREVIDTITSKVVLILGRFTSERKRVLDALRDELRKKDYLPIVFDFQEPANRDLTETVSTLAHMARFVIADITDPKSIPQELMTIVPNLPSVPVQPLLHARSKEYGMFEHFKSFPWVLEAYRYTTVDRLLASLKEHVIEPAEQKAQERAKQ